jgi:hypothetical protein
MEGHGKPQVQFSFKNPQVALIGRRAQFGRV